jgi:Domain of unknown function (DUF6597)
MKYQEYSPHASLRDYLKWFWILERDNPPEDPNEEVIPDACIELIFNFGGPYVLQAEGLREREMSAAFLIGLQNKPLLFRSSGTVKIVAARLYAWGALPFLAIQAQTPSNLALTLSRDWHALTQRLETKVQAGDYEGAVVGLEDFLSRRPDQSRIAANPATTRRKTP